MKLNAKFKDCINLLLVRVVPHASLGSRFRFRWPVSQCVLLRNNKGRLTPCRSGRRVIATVRPVVFPLLVKMKSLQRVVTLFEFLYQLAAPHILPNKKIVVEVADVILVPACLIRLLLQRSSRFSGFSSIQNLCFLGSSFFVSEL